MNLTVRTVRPEDLEPLRDLLTWRAARMPGTARYLPGERDWHLALWPEHLWFATLAGADDAPVGLAALHHGSERDRHATLSLLHDRAADPGPLAEAMTTFVADVLTRWPLRRVLWPVVAGSPTATVAERAGLDVAMTLRSFDVDGADRCDVTWFVADTPGYVPGDGSRPASGGPVRRPAID